MKRSALIALLLVYAAMLAANWVADTIFDRLPHLEDEIAYLYQARLFQRGDAYIETPQPTTAYWQPFVIDCNQRIISSYDVDCLGRRFGKYTPGWPLVLALGTGMQLPWVVNVWLAGLVVALVYRFARELYGDSAALAAALLMTISPIAWILNGSYMGHTLALFLALLFVYALWRIEQGRARLRWGVVAGAALGFLVTTRPLSAAGIAAPLILYSGLRVLAALVQDYGEWRADQKLAQHGHAPAAPWHYYLRRVHFAPTLLPLLAVAVFTLGFAAIYPIFNYTLTGNPNANLYRMVWDYDRIGFGEGHGRSGHSLEKAQRIAKRDTKCYARDLFGWVPQPDQPPDEIATGNECMVDRAGLSWVLLLPGLLLMPRRKWTLLLLLAAASLVLVHFSYWIGAGVYSARYYYEATGLLAIVSGAGVAGLARLLRRWHLQVAVYALLGIAAAFTVLGYIPERLEPIRDYGCINDSMIAEVEALRYSPDTPVMVVAYGEQNGCKGRASWRDYGALMAVTDPYNESDIILLRDLNQSYLEELMAQHPKRQVILMQQNLFQRMDVEGRAGYTQP